MSSVSPYTGIGPQYYRNLMILTALVKIWCNRAYDIYLGKGDVVATYNFTVIGVRFCISWEFLRRFSMRVPTVEALRFEVAVGAKVPVYVRLRWHGKCVDGVTFVSARSAAPALRANDPSLLQFSLGDCGREVQGDERADNDPYVVRSLKLDGRSYNLYPLPTST